MRNGTLRNGLTQKQKLETFDVVLAERDKLRLAVHDLIAGSKFPFRGRVTVNAGREIDGDYPDHVYRVSVSERSMPVYMVECLGHDGQVARVEFWTENEVDAHSCEYGIYWQVVRRGVWKLRLKLGTTAEVAA